MPWEIARKRNGERVMFHGVASGLFNGRLLSVERSSHRSDHGHDGHRSRHEERGERRHHEGRRPHDNSYSYTTYQAQSHAYHIGRYNQYYPPAAGRPVGPSNYYGAYPAYNQGGNYANIPTRPSAPGNSTMAQASGNNYIQNNIQNNYYGGYSPDGSSAGYGQGSRQLQRGGSNIGRPHPTGPMEHNPRPDCPPAGSFAAHDQVSQRLQQAGNDNGRSGQTGQTEHDPHTCDIHPACLKIQLDEARRARTAYGGGSMRSDVSVTPGDSLSQVGQSMYPTPAPSLPWFSSATATTAVTAVTASSSRSPGFQENQQRTAQEYAVANLARIYAPYGFANLHVQPDAEFDMLDCKLLALLYLKHKVDTTRDLQAEFYKATQTMVDIRILEGELDVLDTRTTFTVGSGLSDRHREILVWCASRLRERKMLAIQADFMKETGRMVDLEILKNKLG